MKNNVRDYVFNIESCLGLLSEQNYLIDILQNGYFNKNNVPREKAWGLAWDYKRYQALLSTIQAQLTFVETKFNDNLYPLMKKFKKLNYLELDNFQKICNALERAVQNTDVDEDKVLLAEALVRLKTIESNLRVDD